LRALFGYSGYYHCLPVAPLFTHFPCLLLQHIYILVYLRIFAAFVPFQHARSRSCPLPYYFAAPRTAPAHALRRVPLACAATLHLRAPRRYSRALPRLRGAALPNTAGTLTRTLTWLICSVFTTLVLPLRVTWRLPTRAGFCPTCLILRDCIPVVSARLPTWPTPALQDGGPFTFIVPHHLRLPHPRGLHSSYRYSPQFDWSCYAFR